MTVAYVTPAELGAWMRAPGDWTEPELLLCIESASRAIDRHTGRQFGKVDAPETRRYTPEWFKDRWVVDIDDVQNIDGLEIHVDNDGDGVAESEVVDFDLTPINAASRGFPWTGVEILPRSAVKPNGLRNGVHITALWGWSEVPQAIQTATLIQAARLHERRSSASGPLISQRVDDVSAHWGGGTELDPDVAATIAAYRKYWVAV